MRILELSESLPKDPDAELEKYEADYAEAFNVYKDGVDFYIEDQLELTPEKIKSWGDSWKRFPGLIDDLMHYYRSNGGVTSETKSTWSDMELALMEGGHSIEDWVCGKCNSEPCVCDSIKNQGKLFVALENFANNKINEVLDNPAPYTWRKDEFGFPTAEAKDLGLHISFDGRNDPQWEVSFYREQEDGSFVMNHPTGQGKEFQVFATVNSAIKDFIEMHKDAEGLTLDARKDGGVDNQGRISLYRRMMNNYANTLGWEFEEWDQGQMVMMGIYKPSTNENFADGKKNESVDLVENPLMIIAILARTAVPQISKRGLQWLHRVVQKNFKQPLKATEKEAQQIDKVLTKMENAQRKADRFNANVRAGENMDIGKAEAAEKIVHLGKQEIAKILKGIEKTIESIDENFADGKKKGKSRPGRVKRAGASCKGSVTSLRKKAKNASGEKAKMYHWCANMKSGRKK